MSKADIRRSAILTIDMYFKNILKILSVVNYRYYALIKESRNNIVKHFSKPYLAVYSWIVPLFSFSYLVSSLCFGFFIFSFSPQHSIFSFNTFTRYLVKIFRLLNIYYMYLRSFFKRLSIPTTTEPNFHLFQISYVLTTF